LESLRFAAAQGGARLSEFQIAQPGIYEQRKRSRNLWMRREKFRRFFDGHLHDVANRSAVVEDFEGLRIVAPAVAIFARHITAGQKIHLQFDQALALAGLAPAALGIEREPAR